MSGRGNLGFTLIETVIAVVLLSMLSVGVVGLFFSTLSGRGKAEVYADIKDHGDAAIMNMERTIRNSVAVSSASCTGSSVNRLEITLPGDVPVQYELYEYDTVNHKYRVDKIEGAARRSITGTEVQVESLSFVCIDSTDSFTPTKIKITLVLRKDGNLTQTYRRRFETSVTLRNL